MLVSKSKVLCNSFYTARFYFAKTRQGMWVYSLINLAKIYVAPKYPALPPWSDIKQKDPFDYKLRSYDEIVKEQKEHPPNFPIKVVCVDYPRAVVPEVQDKARKVKK